MSRIMSEAGTRATRPAKVPSLRLVLVFITLGLYALLAPVAYVVFALVALVPSSAPELRIRSLQRIVSSAFIGMHNWLRWLKIVDCDPRGLGGDIPAGRCVVVANHPSLTDTTAIVGGIPGLCTAVRSDLYAKRWLRPLLKGAGHFDAGGPGLLGISRLVENSGQRLAQGFRVLVFPEGTRSPRGSMRPFGRAAFEVACRARVPVVAVLVEEDPVWLAPGDRLIGPPVKTAIKRLRILGIIAPGDFSGDSRKLREYVESLYRHALELSPRSGQTLNEKAPS